MTSSDLFSRLFRDDEVAALFADERFIDCAVKVETALATVQGKLGVIPPEATKKIIKGKLAFKADMEKLQRGVDHAGIPMIELVRQLREQVGKDAGSFVHWGATSQDIMDTALVLQIREALSILEGNLQRLIQSLARLADQHRTTLMAGRTHSQHALPIPFGLKIAGWMAPLLRHRDRLAEIKPRLLVLQFGGAAGTLASLGESGFRVQEALAQELKLSLPLTPWHTQRDSLAELAGWLSLVTGSLAKMAQDVILMAQSEVGELRESADASRGGSSTMPQKSNPMSSEVIIAAARTNASLLSALHHSMIQEHERATHGWQMEWLNLPRMVLLTAAALNKALFLGENLIVDTKRMQANVKASHGLMLAEALNFALTPTMGRVKARQLVQAACEVARDEKRHLVDVVRERTSADIDWDFLKDEAAYFGSSELFIDRVLQDAARRAVRKL